MKKLDDHEAKRGPIKEISELEEKLEKILKFVFSTGILCFLVSH
jgi:hypothetical protein